MEDNKFSAVILDSNIGSTNVTDEETIKKIVFNTFETITKVLQRHCGPYGTFAIEHSVGTAYMEPTFTNDGINIVKAMSFLNPIQDFARRNIAYVGTRVESAIGDGTTTAMILASSFMKYMSDPSNKELVKLLSSVNYSELSNIYNKFVTEAVKAVKDGNSHVSDEASLIFSHAYAQAITSSHGDTVLSLAIAKMYSSIPREAWPYIWYYREPSETDVRYSVRNDCNQFIANTTVMRKTMLNAELGTAYFAKEVDVLVCADRLLSSDQTLWSGVESKIKEAIDTETDFVVLVHDDLDGYTRSALNMLLNDDVDRHVAVFTLHANQPVLNDFRILTLLTKQPSLDTKSFIMKGVTVACHGHELSINKIYEDSNPSSFFTPHLEDTSYPVFKQQVESVKTIIEQIKGESTTRDIVPDLAAYTEIYNKLCFKHKTMIVVGGLAYDNAAAMDVLMDVVCAVSRSLTCGFTPGANSRFYVVLNNFVYGSDPEYLTTNERIWYEICKAFIKALDDVYDGIAFNVPSVNNNKPSNLVKSKGVPNDRKNFVFTALGGWELRDYVADIESSPNYISIQPIELVPQILSRIGEVCLKFLKTSSIITTDGVYTPPKVKKTPWFLRLFKRK